MRKRILLSAVAITLLGATLPAQALQCVPYAREASGISLRGDAWTWWNGAAGIYERGHAPRFGAVVVFRKFGSMRRGHVAVVVRVVNAREVLVDHANWGPRRGAISTMAAVRDVSPHNDWTEVRVWNPATHDLGVRTYPTYGFIYPQVPGAGIRDAMLSTASQALPYPGNAVAFDELLPTVVARALANVQTRNLPPVTPAVAMNSEARAPDLFADATFSSTAPAPAARKTGFDAAPVIVDANAVVDDPLPPPVPVASSVLPAPAPSPATIAVAATSKPVMLADGVAPKAAVRPAQSPTGGTGAVWAGDAAAALSAGSGHYGVQ